mmetsp:Transcript_16752/g.48634  ORF Transcript_16752/g.48634 Transcript_16752/m.48634 type:complete len:231 (+) Transcript_16752:758-1450(+)
MRTPTRTGVGPPSWVTTASRAHFGRGRTPHRRATRNGVRMVSVAPTRTARRSSCTTRCIIRPCLAWTGPSPATALGARSARSSITPTSAGWSAPPRQRSCRFPISCRATRRPWTPCGAASTGRRSSPPTASCRRTSPWARALSAKQVVRPLSQAKSPRPQPENLLRARSPVCARPTTPWPRCPQRAPLPLRRLRQPRSRCCSAAWKAVTNSCPRPWRVGRCRARICRPRN